tara:strand:- start:955 stop:2439 length:1485 start_codon:yes stop_codon:yes gene_type:complete
MEKFFWADQIAEDIIKRNKNKKIYTCASGITPSGTIHIGAFREVITTDLVVKALEKKGKKVRFIYSWDNYDRFRKVPANVPKTHEKYLGMPVSDVPAPSGKGKYSNYFEKPFEIALKKVGVNPKFISQSKMNKQCKYASLIKLAIEKKEKIKKILNRYRKEPLKDNWFPVTVYCEKCKKDFTNVISVKNYTIEYECSCGFKNKVNFSKKGIVKAPWRVDWPMRWKYEKVDFEPGGIDHSVEGGSFTTAKEISKEVFSYEPPMYVFYDWIKLKGGAEFSSSTGNALSLDEVLEIYEPEILRYLFVGTKPKTGFQISFDNDVIKIYDEFDALERKYYEKLLNPQEKRIYELSKLKITKEKPTKESFRHLTTLVQTRKIKGLSKENKARAEKVSNWLEKYAGEDMKFSIKEKVDFNITGKEKEAMVLLKETLSVGKLNEDKLFNEFYNICQATGISNKDFFETAYLIIIGKRKGPRLANLIISIGKEKIIKLLEQIK